MIKKNTKENNNMNPVVKYIIIALTTIGVAGASIFMVYRSNEVKQASQVAEVQSGVDVSLLNDKSEQETTDVDNLAKELYENYKDQLKEGTTLEDWVKQFKIYSESIDDETEVLNCCLNYFAPDTILPGDVEDPESMEVKVDEEDADIVNLEMTGEPDDATDVATAETTEVQQEDNSSENSEASTSTETPKNYEVEYYDESKTMYAIRNVNIRKGPDSKDFDKVASLSTNESIKVVGVVEEYNGEDTFWLAVEYKGEEYYISGAYLSDSKVAVSSSGNTSSNNSQQSQSSQSNTTSNSSQQSSGFTPEQQAILDKLKNAPDHDYTPTFDGNNATGQSTGGINWGN